MKKQKFLSVACMLMIASITIASAQQGNVSAGGSISGTGGSMSYSVGQTDYLNYTSEAGSISFGLQQPWFDTPGVPPILNVPDTNIVGGESLCFNATVTVILGGSGKEFVVEAGGHADVIAGQNILLKHGTRIKEGGSLHARISAEWCYPDDDLKIHPLAVIAEDIMADKSLPVILSNENQNHPLFFKVYPNPGNGIFTVEFFGTNTEMPKTIMVFSLMGELITKIENPTGHTVTINIMNAKPGIYPIIVTTNSFTGTAKLIKH